MRLSDLILEHWSVVRPAPWLQAVADGVVELVDDLAVLRRFRELVRTWRRAYRPTLGGMTLLPPWPLSLPEQVVLLSAIHDALAGKHLRIDPWAAAEVRAHRLEAVTFAVAVQSVIKLRDKDRDDVEGVLGGIRRQVYGRFVA
jgi:hypothetical protein